MIIDNFKGSYVEDFEIPEAIKIIEDSLGFKMPSPVENQMVVKVYVRPDDVWEVTDEDGNPVLGETGQQLCIAVPERFRAQDQYDSIVGLVLSQGPDCYKSERYKGLEPYCRIGSWIVFPRQEGSQVNYRGIPIQIIRDFHIFETIEDPKFISKK